MPRYIDADALKERLEYFSKWCKDGRKQGVDFVLDCPLPDLPTADVAPRAEVAREILADIRDKGGFNDPFVEYICLSYDELIALERKYTKADPPEGE